MLTPSTTCSPGPMRMLSPGLQQAVEWLANEIGLHNRQIMLSIICSQPLSDIVEHGCSEGLSVCATQAPFCTKDIGGTVI